MAKRFLYLEDLYNLLSSQNTSTRFSYSQTENKEPIVVHVDGKVNFEEDSKLGLTAVKLQSCHTGKNLNGSNIADDVMESALPSFVNRPILGYIHNVNGEDHFYNHTMHLEDDEIVYDEIPVGIIPESCDAKLVYDEDKKRTYVEVKGYLFDEYTKASEILKREQECSVSVELSIKELSYNAKEKYLEIEDFYFSGVTILGKTPDGEDVMPGMEGSNIKLADFSAENNSMLNLCSKLDSLQEKVDYLLSRFDINEITEEGGIQVTKFEELLEKYNKTVEDIDFEYENMSDEELETKFAEVFETEEEVLEEPESDETGETNEGDEGTGTPENETSEGEAEFEEEVVEEAEANEEIEEVVENMTRSFEVSHDDIRYALYNLLTEYEEADNTWYWITAVYDSYFVYENYNNAIFGQNYVVEEDNVSLDGERFNLHRELLRDSEYAALKEMRANYEALKEFKANVEKNERIASLKTVMNDERYSVISETESYKNLYENIENYTKEELEKELKVILGEYALNGGKFEKAVEEKTPKFFTNVNKKKKNNTRYGSLKFNK